MIKIFLDSSDINAIKEYRDKVDGVTTNPTLMRKAGVIDYEKFCKEVLEIIPDKPVSFEVFADDFDEMERQARKISSWGENVYVKIPIMNTKGKRSNALIKRLTQEIKLNVTAIMTSEQVFSLPIPKEPMIISVFAGRIADTGIDPIPIIRRIKVRLHCGELLWASPREALNIYQAEYAGADIITCTPELLAKYEKMKRYNLTQLSLDTVRMFYEDGQAAGYKL